MTVVKQNFSALKAIDNLKWDFKALYQISIPIFDASGEINDEYRKILTDLGKILESSVENLKSLENEYKLLCNLIFNQQTSLD